jgi:anti-sigma regulatory factor (Ser/Thr protein kinase)
MVPEGETTHPMQVQSRRSETGAGHRLDLEVPATPGMLSGVRAALTELPLSARALDDARLLVSELVANSMRHARLGPNDTIRVTAEVGHGRLRIDVVDGGRDGTRVLAGAIRPRPGAESGWGLYLVETLSSRWGYGAGRYWFELEIDDPSSH